MISKYLFTLIAAIMTMLPVEGKEISGTQVLDEVAKRFSSHKSVTAVYDMSDGNNSASGTLAMSGEKFHLSSDDLMVWYDGNTQWSFMPSSNEVNIVEPTPEELTQVNPLVIINSFRKVYNARTLTSGNGHYKVELTPVNTRGAYIGKAVLTVNSTSFMPEKIMLTTNSGANITINIKSLKTGTNYPASTFVFNKKQYPKAEVIDLR